MTIAVEHIVVRSGTSGICQSFDVTEGVVVQLDPIDTARAEIIQLIK